MPSSNSFYDISNSFDTIEYKSEIDIYDDETIPLCDICGNIKLLPYQDTKLICPNCGHVENPQYEHIQTQAMETTIDEISGRGEITFKDDSIPQKKTLNRLSNNHENLDYVNKEFNKYKETELVDKTIRKLNKKSLQ